MLRFAIRRSLLGLCALVFALGCTSMTNEDLGREEARISPCRARLTWLQKDAYLSQAGRSSELWPPHTTMVLTVSCDAGTIREVVRVNHGTAPDAVDDAGETILVEVYAEEIEGDRAGLLDLADRFEGCECESTFLSLDSLDASLVASVLEELSLYASENLSCPPSVGGTEAVVEALAARDIETVLEAAPQCTWASGTSFETGLDEALAVVTASADEILVHYHVCNNDALLQADLFARYAGGAEAATCDGGSTLCAGPSWFYAPAEE